MIVSNAMTSQKQLSRVDNQIKLDFLSLMSFALNNPSGKLMIYENRMVG